MVLSKSLILRFFCRFVGKNVTKFLCYIDLLKVTKLTRLTVAHFDGQIPFLQTPFNGEQTCLQSFQKQTVKTVISNRSSFTVLKVEMN